MVSTIRHLVTQLENMENSFLSIFFETANKIAELTESKLFVVMESSDGLRRIGGHAEMRQAFQLGTLGPHPSDIEVDGDGSSHSAPELWANGVPANNVPRPKSSARKRKRMEECD